MKINKKKAGIISGIVIVAVLISVFLVYPYITFKRNEATLLNAAKRYYTVNTSMLPTGNRIKTLKLTDLYKYKFIENDLKTPLSNNLCQVSNSWVKVKKVDGEYKYYTYLRCGVFSSNIDHKGPNITLNGKSEITINKGEEYKELGVSSVSDDTDGKIDINKVEINNKKVNTKKIGTYKVSYTIEDSLNNKTKVIRKINVVSRLNHEIEVATKKKNTYVGSVRNNYIKVSGTLFRIIGLDGDKVKIVSDENISYIDYKSLDKWLDYYYENLTDSAKKYIVKNKYCNDKVSDINTRQCNSYTKERYVYVPSIIDYNNTLDSENNSYMLSSNLTITPNLKNNNEVWVSRNFFLGDNDNSKFMAFDIKTNVSAKPMMTLKSDIYLSGGDGSYSNPFEFESSPAAKPGDNINTRYSGEYIDYGNHLWRISSIEGDYTKVIMTDTLGRDITTKYNTSSKNKIYNPKEQGNVAYFINNKALDYIKTSYFVSHEIEVPIYKNQASYTGNKTIKKYNVILSAPSIYDLYSFNDTNGHWMIESSKTQYRKYVVSDIGDLFTNGISDREDFEISLEAYFNKNITIKSGSGTKFDPFVLAK